jgi:predicted DNA-binding antitoxin AbrB/MazE fold protein
MQTIEAIYEHGVLRPLQALDLPEHTQVALAILVSPHNELLLAAQQQAAARDWDDAALDVYNE